MEHTLYFNEFTRGRHEGSLTADTYWFVQGSPWLKLRTNCAFILVGYYIKSGRWNPLKLLRKTCNLHHLRQNSIQNLRAWHEWTKRQTTRSQMTWRGFTHHESNHINALYNPWRSPWFLKNATFWVIHSPALTVQYVVNAEAHTATL